MGEQAVVSARLEGMSTTPRFDALLAELCGLDELDLQLPLVVLVNLHRARLRAPLRGLVVHALAGGGELRTLDDVQRLDARLAKTHGLDEDVLGADSAVSEHYNMTREAAAWYDGGEATRLPEYERLLMRAMDEDWHSFDPVSWFFYLSCREVDEAHIPELLEAELTVQPQAHRMVLEMADLAHRRASVSAH
jgi:hypothetical protein